MQASCSPGRGRTTRAGASPHAHHNPHATSPLLTHRSGPAPTLLGWDCAPQSQGAVVRRPFSRGPGQPPCWHRLRCRRRHGPQAGHSIAALPPVLALCLLKLRNHGWPAAGADVSQMRRCPVTAAGLAAVALWGCCHRGACASVAALSRRRRLLRHPMEIVNGRALCPKVDFCSERPAGVKQVHTLFTSDQLFEPTVEVSAGEESSPRLCAPRTCSAFARDSGNRHCLTIKHETRYGPTAPGRHGCPWPRACC